MINGRKHFRYGNASACGECPFRQHCTKGSARVILRDANEEVVERMRERLTKEENRAQYRLRAHAAESPYGNAKRNLKFSYVLRRGIGKVRMEMALLFMLHNGMKLRLCMSG